ncbi:MAG: glycerol-3-phosphate dehydrogenase [Spirochaetaceae bacterium]|nr:glycerol-3-phosphate dehydrogenase [Spirochaetaceae bacterium]|tara:strand:- start:3392 stop:5032 length:1641 start_codon:yes stop_codon:yes gene_type:complete
MKRFIENTVEGEEFDLVIIGGGITGACIAYEGASRGLKVALFEKGDFGGATSAATSKLIHGGLRYLNYLEFGLVRESLRERRILEDIAPNLVYPLPFLIPNYGNLKSNKWIIKAGMILYDLLSFDKGHTRHKSKKLPHHRSLKKSEVLQIAPLLPPEGLTGGAVYYDCQSVAPERLTLSFIKSATAFGAQPSNYAEVVHLEKEQGRFRTATVKDCISGKTVNVRGRLFINSGGPWAERIIKKLSGQETAHSVRMSEGIHIIGPQITKDHALVLLTPGGRHFFAIPWRGYSLYGTTDKDYQGSPDQYRVSKESIDEFVEEINSTLKEKLLDYSNIVHAYGGLRPLTDTHTESSYKSSRKYEIIDGEKEGLAGLITVEGGKYTTSRNLAQSALKVIGKKLGRKLPPSRTARLPLVGSDMPGLTDYLASRKEVYPEFASNTLHTLSVNYGTEMEKIVELSQQNPEWKETLNDDGEILGQVVFAVREEMAVRLLDVLQRRTGLGTLGMPGDDALEKIAGCMARELGWDENQKKEEIRSAVEKLKLPFLAD